MEDFSKILDSEPTEDNETILDLKNDVVLNMIGRELWSALPAKERIPHLFYPVPYIRFVHTSDGDGEPCRTTEECTARVQALQRGHMAQGLPDIAYNFLIGGDGCIYEGRGWHGTPPQIEDKLKHYDGARFDMTFIGKLSEESELYTEMAQTAMKLMNFALFSNFLKRPFTFIEGDDDKMDGPLKKYLHS